MAAHDLLLQPPSELQPPSHVLDVSVGADVLPVRGTGEPESNPRVERLAPLIQESPDVPAVYDATPPNDLHERSVPAVLPAAVDDTRTAEIPVVNGQLTEGQVRQLLAEVGTPPEWIEPFIRIAWCESKWSPGAQGDNGASVGLYQIGKSRPGWQGWFLYLGIDEATALDPLVNTRTTVAIAHYSVARGQSPFNAWTCQP